MPTWEVSSVSEPYSSSSTRCAALRVRDWNSCWPWISMRSSPVSTVSPGRNSSSTESMRAKSRICRWLSMAEPQPSALDAAAAPVQLRAQDLVVIVRRRMQQRHVLARSAGLQAIAGHERAEYRAVADDVRAGVGSLVQCDLDDGARRHDDRAV